MWSNIAIATKSTYLPEVVATFRVLSMDQIELFDI